MIYEFNAYYMVLKSKIEQFNEIYNVGLELPTWKYHNSLPTSIIYMFLCIYFPLDLFNNE